MVRCFPYVFRRLSPSEMIFKASATSKRKDNSPQARLPWTCRRQLLCEPHTPTGDDEDEPRRRPRVNSSPHNGFGILVRIPFPPLRTNGRPASASRKKPYRPRVAAWLPKAQLGSERPRKQTPFQGGFPRGLGPTYPCPSTVHTETYSASVFCVNLINRIIATTTKICTRHAISRRLTPNASTRAPRPPTRLWENCCWIFLPVSRLTIGDLLEHRPFSGLVHSAGELLHTP